MAKALSNAEKFEAINAAKAENPKATVKALCEEYGLAQHTYSYHVKKMRNAKKKASKKLAKKNKKVPSNLPVFTMPKEVEAETIPSQPRGAVIIGDPAFIANVLRNM